MGGGRDTLGSSAIAATPRIPFRASDSIFFFSNVCSSRYNSMALSNSCGCREKRNGVNTDKKEEKRRGKEGRKEGMKEGMKEEINKNKQTN